LGLLALTRRAEAALLEASVGQGFSASLSVAAVEPGVVRVSGDVETSERRDEAERIVRGVKGVASVENAIRVLPRRRADT
jgi:osmotically-inducible protein OsmY